MLVKAHLFAFGQLTVASVLQTATRGELNAIDLGRGKDTIEERVEEVVSQDGSSNLVVCETPNALLGPSDFALELVELQGRGAQKGRSRAAGYIVAAESEEVDEYRETERDAEGADAALPRVS